MRSLRVWLWVQVVCADFETPPPMVSREIRIGRPSFLSTSTLEAHGPTPQAQAWVHGPMTLGALAMPCAHCMATWLAHAQIFMNKIALIAYQ
jgi:hypothetical protein